MGVPAVKVLQHASLLKDALRSTDDRLRIAKLRPSVKRSGLCWPMSPRRVRLAPARRSMTIPAAMTGSASVSNSCKPTPARYLNSSLDLATGDLATGAAPASGMEPQSLLETIANNLSGYQLDLEDLGLDYREAAAALELLYSESPSLETAANLEAEGSTKSFALSSSSAAFLAGAALSRASQLRGLKRKDRKDLDARISLRRKRLGECGDRHSQAGGQSLTKVTNSIWSPAAFELLQQHGESVNFTAQNWSRLGDDLLTAEEERWLGSLMKPAKGFMVLKEHLRHRLSREPTNEEWAKAAKLDVATLARHLALHRAARNKIVKMNLRLVKYQARKYDRESAGSSLTVTELCQEGVKGLITAVDRFDSAKGLRFSTYAVFWIRNSIVRAQTRSGHPIRSPFHLAELKMSINKARWEMKLDSAEDSEGQNLRKVLEQAGIDEEKYKAIMRSTPRVISFQKKDPLTGAELIERLADPRSRHEANAKYLVGSGVSGIEASDPLLRLGLDDVLDSLEPKESSVLRQRFGLDGKGERSLGEIGRNMRMSREMARRYEARGLLKLKHPARLAYLRSCLPDD